MYEIKVLDSEQFDSVAKSDPRYSYVDDTNMGFADRQKGVAYVRNSHVHDLNKYLINHELEEMLEDKSEHEDDNGIRHKKFFRQAVKPFITPGFHNPFIEAFKSPENQNVGFGGLQKATPGGGIGSEEPQTAQSFGGNQQFSLPQTAVPPQVASTPSNNFVGQGGTGALSPNQSGNPLSGIGDIDPELAQRVKGFFGGRLNF